MANSSTIKLEPSTRPVGPRAGGTGLRYLALGDSFTAGSNLAESERMPAQLMLRLRAMGVNIEDPLVLARAGWTAADLSAAAAQTRLEGHFDLITLLVGVNNQYYGQPPETFRQQLRELAVLAGEYAGGEPKRVLMLSLPDWGQSPFARNFNRALIGEQIDAFNQIIRAEAALAGARFVEITSRSRALYPQEGMVVSDGLHPSARHYTAWMELIFPEALAALGRF